ncbi:MAG: response regulator [Proteobacteria bacterium]|nr:response regulator [Pseudomonadota bacterium]
MYIVGIGASAGGLSALQVLLSSMPPQPGFACVIVMHLSPDHESHLAEFLQPSTPMPVTQVNATIALEANHVYVIPPNANLNSIDTHLRLSELEERRLERAPIDHFLRTLASTHDGTAIVIILTGAGADGSIGVRYISQCGGLAIAQDPQEAEFDSMPRSAIATGAIDIVLPLRRMAGEILRFCNTRPQLPVPDGEGRIQDSEEALLKRVTTDLEQTTHQNFDVYRRPRLLKRLRRRMQLQHVTRVKDYLDILGSKKQEAEALAEDLLLAPTEFFGDPGAFRELEKKIIPELLERKSGTDGRLRVWTIGCSTGEEAYSLAILCTEAAEEHGRPVRLQIFATDNSARSLAAARDGVYPREIGAAVSAKRLERFFTAERGSFRVKRPIRDVVLFAAHSLFRDPPFARIDLIVCRNLMNELQPEVRRAVLALFHYALEPQGLLVLGDQDAQQADGFEPLQADSGTLLRKIPGPRHHHDAPALVQPFAAERTQPQRPSSAGDINIRINGHYQSALESYAPPSVLINAANEVVHFAMTASRYLRIPGGALTDDLTRLVPEPARSALLEGLRVLRNGAKNWRSEPLSLAAEDGLRRICLRLERVAATELILVVFDDRDQGTSRPELHAEAAQIIVDLEAQIRSLNSRLQELTRRPVTEDLNTVRGMLDEATAELHLVLGELAASKEELQAVNEELVALDDENRRRLAELTQISTDLQHLLASTGVATLFLDRNLNIVRFTPLFGDLFGLRATDIGRRVSDLTRLAQYQGLEDDAVRVLGSLQPVEQEIMRSDGRWYLSRMLPYRTAAGLVQGLVLTFMDITDRKRAELALQAANRGKDEFLAVLGHELRNPLAPISSGVEVLKAAPGDRDIVKKMAATMGRQTQQLVRLVDDLLEVSRISGGKLQIRTAPLDLREVIQDAIAAARSAIERAGHSLEVALPAEPIRIMGDAARLVQVVSNLLNNAVRYTPSPGTIAVRATCQQNLALLEVEDTGVGVPQDLLENIFEMFFQGANTQAEGGAGLGIGLTLAKTLVELHGGQITARSGGAHQGSTFEIRLPLARDVELPCAVQPEQPIGNGEHRILIVDDNTDAAETLRALLKSLGENQVFTVSSGEQALESASELHPDIVLLDLMMPGIDGYEVARRMRRQPWGKDLMIVALSGWGQDEHRRRTREAGFDRHVTKPADLVALRSVLHASTPIHH